MSDLKLDQPQRQSMVGVAVIFLKNLRRALNFYIAVIFVQWGGEFKMLGLSTTHWGILLAIIFLIISYLQYLRFFFYVSGEYFIVERGVLRREKTSISFDRIQTVNTTQNVIQQLLGVVGLKIETAGSAGQEIEIPALGKNHAWEVQHYLMQHKKQKSHDGEEQEGELDVDELRELENSEPLLRLSLPALLRVGLTENHLRSGFVLFAIINGYMWQYEEYLLRPFESYLEDHASGFVTSWMLMLPSVIAVFLVVSVIASLVRVILRYYNLKFWLADGGLRMHSGLLRRNVFRIPRRKVQYFRWSSNPLRQRLGIRTLRVKQAGSEEVSARSSITVPGLVPRDIVKVFQNFYGGRRIHGQKTFRAHHLLFIQLFIWGGLIPVLALSGYFYYQDFPIFFYLPLPLLLVLVGFFTHRYYQSVALRCNESFIEVRKGWIFPTRTTIEQYKLQNLSLSQSIFQKRRKLASLAFHTAAGSQTMPHLPENVARELYDLMLYRIESSEKSWM